MKAIISKIFNRKKRTKQRHVVLLKAQYGDSEWYDVLVDGCLAHGGSMVSYEEAKEVYLKWISNDSSKTKRTIIQETTIEI